MHNHMQINVQYIDMQIHVHVYLHVIIHVPRAFICFAIHTYMYMCIGGSGDDSGSWSR